MPGSADCPIWGGFATTRGERRAGFSVAGFGHVGIDRAVDISCGAFVAVGNSRS